MMLTRCLGQTSGLALVKPLRQESASQFDIRVPAHHLAVLGRWSNLVAESHQMPRRSH